MRPEKPELAAHLEHLTYAQTALIYSVGASAVAKWAVRYGLCRTRRGMAHHLSKLTEDDVHLIRECQGEIPARDLMDKFDISATTVYEIWQHKTWWWLQPRARSKAA